MAQQRQTETAVGMTSARRSASRVMTCLAAAFVSLSPSPAPGWEGPDLPAGLRVGGASHEAPGECEVPKGQPGDCNENGILDECDLRTPVALSTGIVSPFGAGLPQTFFFSAAPHPGFGAMTLRIRASGDYGSNNEFVTVRINGIAIIDALGGTGQCVVNPPTFEFFQSTTNLPACATGVAISLDASDEVNPLDCSGNSFIEVSLHYDALGIETDCNTNRIPDGCDIASGVLHDENANGVPDECKAIGTPPRLEIDHARMCDPIERVANSGYIDPRRESNNGTALNTGMSAITFIFNRRVFNVGSTQDGAVVGILTPAAFEIRQTGPVAPPTVTSVTVDASDSRKVTLQLSRIITLQEWTTIIAHVEDACGETIANEGDMGPGAYEPDRIDIGFLPADISQDGVVSPVDLLRYKQYRNDLIDPVCLHDFLWLNINRNQVIDPLDYLALKQLIIGVIPSTQSWAGKRMNHVQP